MDLKFHAPGLESGVAALRLDIMRIDAWLYTERWSVYLARRKHESSLMAKGIFAGAARESRAVADG